MKKIKLLLLSLFLSLGINNTIQGQTIINQVIESGSSVYELKDDGDITKIHGVATSFPNSQSEYFGLLFNDANGNLSWLSPKSGFYVYEEFIQSSGILTWSTSSAGSASGGSRSSGNDTTHCGMMSCETQSAGDHYGRYTYTSAFGFDTTTWYIGFLVEIQTLSDASDDFTVIVGLNDACNGSIGADGAMFKYNHALNSGNWTGYTAESSTSTEASGGSSVAASTDWMWLEIVGNSTTVTFYVDGTSIGSSSSNIPAMGRCGLEFVIDRTADSAGDYRLIRVDKVYAVRFNS